MPRPKKPTKHPAPPDKITFTVAAGGRAAIAKRIAPAKVGQFVRNAVAEALGMPELLDVRPVGNPTPKKPG